MTDIIEILRRVAAGEGDLELRLSAPSLAGSEYGDNRRLRVGNYLGAEVGRSRISARGVTLRWSTGMQIEFGATTLTVRWSEAADDHFAAALAARTIAAAIGNDAEPTVNGEIAASGGSRYDLRAALKSGRIDEVDTASQVAGGRLTLAAVFDLA